MTEIEAKVKYVKLARSLRTYGVSFFLVKVTYILLTILYGWLCITSDSELVKGQRCSFSLLSEKTVNYYVGQNYNYGLDPCHTASRKKLESVMT